MIHGEQLHLDGTPRLGADSAFGAVQVDSYTFDSSTAGSIDAASFQVLSGITRDSPGFQTGTIGPLPTSPPTPAARERATRRHAVRSSSWRKVPSSLDRRAQIPAGSWAAVVIQAATRSAITDVASGRSRSVREDPYSARRPAQLDGDLRCPLGQRRLPRDMTVTAAPDACESRGTCSSPRPSQRTPDATAAGAVGSRPCSRETQIACPPNVPTAQGSL